MATRRPNDPPRPTEIPKVIQSPDKQAAPGRAADVPNIIKSDEKGPVSAPQKAAAPRAKKPASKPSAKPIAVSEDARRAMIAEAAYHRSQRRGFAPGHEHEDWVAAEKEVDALLKSRHGGAAQ